ncbi:Keratin-associated protein 20-1-like protein [Aix galericulata]|nr:Keratin-associated protein 20-1-like protein [Aix galericulata]
MTYYYQNQCEDSCYSPCSYGTVYSYRTYDCGSPCGYRGYGGLYGYRDCYPSYSSRYYPCSTRYTRRYSLPPSTTPKMSCYYVCCSPCYRSVSTSYRAYRCCSPCYSYCCSPCYSYCCSPCYSSCYSPCSYRSCCTRYYYPSCCNYSYGCC